MRAIVLGEDDGFVDITVRSPVAVDPATLPPGIAAVNADESVTVRVDTVKTLNDLAAMTRGPGADESAFLSAASDYFLSLGLPRMSHKATAAAVVAIADRVREPA